MNNNPVTSAFDDQLIWIWTEPDVLTQHLLSILDEERTVCGIDRNYLPDEKGVPGDKPWYSDHDRDDVVGCAECRAALPSTRRLMFNLKIWYSRVHDDLSPEQQQDFWEEVWLKE